MEDYLNAVLEGTFCIEPSFLYLHVFIKLYFLSMFNDLANFNEYVVSYWFDGVTVNVAEPSEPLRSLIEFDTAFW